MKSRLQRELESLRNWIVNSWITQADEQELDRGIAELAVYYEKSPTDNIRDRIQREIGNTYNEIVNLVINIPMTFRNCATFSRGYRADVICPLKLGKLFIQQ